jgi:hypothetical protein
MFELHQRVFLIEGENNKEIAIACLEDLNISLVESCRKYNTSNIHLYGNEDYIKPLIEEILTYSESKYGYNEINIEVN